MKKNLFHISFLTLVFMIYSNSLLCISELRPQKDSLVNLKKILKKCAEYCERLTNSALFFVCQERIEEEIWHSRPGLGGINRILKYPGDTVRQKNEKNVYVYDYKFILKDKKIEESRVLIKENEEKRFEKDARLKTKMFKDKHVIFEPIGIFSNYWQEHYDYKITDSAKIRLQKAIVIKAIPKSSDALDHISVKIWLKESDFGILRVVWEQLALIGFEGVVKTTEGLNVKSHLTFISEFFIEKNGIRFPTKYFVKESYIGPEGKRRFTRSETSVIYENYRFITIKNEFSY